MALTFIGGIVHRFPLISAHCSQDRAPTRLIRQTSLTHTLECKLRRRLAIYLAQLQRKSRSTKGGSHHVMFKKPCSPSNCIERPPKSVEMDYAYPQKESSGMNMPPSKNPLWEHISNVNVALHTVSRLSRGKLRSASSMKKSLRRQFLGSEHTT